MFERGLEFGRVPEFLSSSQKQTNLACRDSGRANCELVADPSEIVAQREREREAPVEEVGGSLA